MSRFLRSSRSLRRFAIASATVVGLALTGVQPSEAEETATGDPTWAGVLQYERHTSQSMACGFVGGLSTPGVNATDVGTMGFTIDEAWTITIPERESLSTSVLVDAVIEGSASIVSTWACSGVETARRTVSVTGSAPIQVMLTAQSDDESVVLVETMNGYGSGGLPGTLTIDGTPEPTAYYPRIQVQATLAQGRVNASLPATVSLDSVGGNNQTEYLVDDQLRTLSDWGTAPMHVDLTRTLPRVPEDACPNPLPRVPAVTSKADATVGSRRVHFRLDPAAPSSPLIRYVLGFGDGKASSIARGQMVSHTYATVGEKRPSLVLIYKTRCVSDPRYFHAVADPVTTYAPALHLHKTEKYFPDSVDRFLANATLVRDRPNLGKKLTSAGCRDAVLAKGSDVSLAAFKKSRGNTKVPKKVPALRLSKLGKKSTSPYAFTENKSRLGRCVSISKRTKAYQAGAKKAGSMRSKDDGLVLSLAGRPASVLAGDTGLKRAKAYVVFKPGRYVAYWFWYPYNGWKMNAKGKDITERHEGDWEHVTVSLATHDGRMESAAYYQHYCAAKIYPRTELRLESGTHPPVWAAKGGHASYHKNVGRKLIGSCWKGGPNGPTDTTSSGGKVLRLWQKTAAGASRLVDATQQSWYGFRGAWGDPRTATFANYGPQAPGGQSGGLPAGW